MAHKDDRARGTGQKQMALDPGLKKAMKKWTQRFGGVDTKEKTKRRKDKTALEEEKGKSPKSKDKKSDDASPVDKEASGSTKISELERLRQHDPEQKELERKIKAVTKHRELLHDRLQIWSSHRVPHPEETNKENEETNKKEASGEVVENSEPSIGQDTAPTANTPSYGAGAAYWDQRYCRSREPFDWLQSYLELSYILNYIQGEIIGAKDQKILNVGCGNSLLTEDMYDYGYHNIINIDISSVVIGQMKTRNEILRPEMQWLVADCTATDFEDASMDLIIDKGTMDTLRCTENANDVCHRFVIEVARLLKPNGVYICISFGAPSTRTFIFEDILNVQHFELPPGPQKKHKEVPSRNYAYVCQKMRKTGEVASPTSADNLEGCQPSSSSNEEEFAEGREDEKENEADEEEEDEEDADEGNVRGMNDGNSMEGRSESIRGTRWLPILKTARLFLRTWFAKFLSLWCSITYKAASSK